MNRVLVIAEHVDGIVNLSTHKSVACALQVPDAQVDVAVLSANGKAAEHAAKLAGIQRVILVRRDEFAEPVAATLAPAIVELAANYSHVFAPSTTFGKDVLPRVAALLDVGQLSDIMAVNGAHSFVRPIYAGNALVHITTNASQKVLATVRVASFQPVAETGNAPIEPVTINVTLPTHTRFAGRSSDSTGRPDLQSAARVVSGGRALGSADNFKLIYQLADQLGAAVGASRAAVDAGYAANDLQVGQTGKIIAPDLYIAVGISGAIQHLTGIKDARTIVAINKDPEAPIFEVADVGLVGDLFTVLPEMQKQLG
ncbi:MAG TPA: FAD-binding protein [Steroidobacteraceae bacterium]|nr:FAD-binding protein [Steroidobacteraceae bacterium]